MPSPTRIYQYFTDAELAVALSALKQEAVSGTITSTGGAGKTAGLQVLALDVRMQAMNLEMDIRGRKGTPQKVTQVLTECGYGFGRNNFGH